MEHYDPEHVLAYVEGELSEPDREAFEAALATDGHLRALVERLQADRVMLRGLADEPAPAGLVDQAVGRLERAALLGEPAAGPMRAGRAGLWRRRIGPAAGVAAAAAVVVLAGWAIVRTLVDPGPIGVPTPLSQAPPSESSEGQQGPRVAAKSDGGGGGGAGAGHTAAQGGDVFGDSESADNASATQPGQTPAGPEPPTPLWNADRPRLTLMPGEPLPPLAPRPRANEMAQTRGPTQSSPPREQGGAVALKGGADRPLARAERSRRAGERSGFSDERRAAAPQAATEATPTGQPARGDRRSQQMASRQSNATDLAAQSMQRQRQSAAEPAVSLRALARPSDPDMAKRLWGAFAEDGLTSTWTLTADPAKVQAVLERWAGSQTAQIAIVTSLPDAPPMTGADASSALITTNGSLTRAGTPLLREPASSWLDPPSLALRQAPRRGPTTDSQRPVPPAGKRPARSPVQQGQTLDSPQREAAAGRSAATEARHRDAVKSPKAAAAEKPSEASRGEHSVTRRVTPPGPADESRPPHRWWVTIPADRVSLLQHQLTRLASQSRLPASASPARPGINAGVEHEALAGTGLTWSVDSPLSKRWILLELRIHSPRAATQPRRP